MVISHHHIVLQLGSDTQNNPKGFTKDINKLLFKVFIEKSTRNLDGQYPVFKLHRNDAPNLLVLKHNIKYLYKDESLRANSNSPERDIEEPDVTSEGLSDEENIGDDED